MKIDELTMQFDEPPIHLQNLYNLIDYHPLTVSPDNYVIDVVRLMNQQKPQNLPSTSLNSSCTYGNRDLQETSYALVVEAGHLLGIFTERDLIRLTASKVDLSQVKIVDVMTHPVVTIKLSEFQDIFAVLSLLDQHQIRHLPILNDKKQLKGIVTATSVLRELNNLKSVKYVPVLQKSQQIKFCDESSKPKYRLLRPDGSMGWIWDRRFLMQDPQGKVFLYGSIAKDITERKQAEESLKQSEARLSLALESANMGIWDWNILTNETLWSANMGSLYGLPNTTLCPSPEDFLQLVHPQDREIFSQTVNNSIEQGGQFTIEYRTIWPDGSIHWLSGRGKVHYNETGKAMRMIGTTRDISERKQAEIALKESEELYRSVVTTMSEGIVLYSADGKIIACNHSAEKILGLSREQIMARTCADERWRTIIKMVLPSLVNNIQQW